jgi:hypothetical protein
MSDSAKMPTTTASGARFPSRRTRSRRRRSTCIDHTGAQTRAYLMETFGISRATAWRRIAQAQKLMAEEAEEERPYLRARATLRLLRLADKAEDAGEYSAAVQAVRGISKVNGLEVNWSTSPASRPSSKPC